MRERLCNARRDVAAVRKPCGSRSARRRRAAYAAPIAIAIALGAGASIATGADLHAVDTAKLHYVGAVGEEVYETGGASGTLPGSMRVHMIFASTFSGSFAIYTRGGRIDGHGKATPHGEGVYESFAGTLVVTGGTGRYRRAHGTAHLYGTFNRENYALTIQTAGTLRF
jgi:uncharacterized membrane protein